MNSLLFAPGLLFLYLQHCGLKRTVAYLSICAGVQLAVGAPFLLTYPVSYLTKAFELSRVFMYTWTVNLKFLSEESFVSKRTAAVLLGGHLLLLAVFFLWKWQKPVKSTLQVQDAVAVKDAGSSKSLRGADPGSKEAAATSPLSSSAAASASLFVLFTSNFIGICFSRTLHYQFLSWYFHCLPLLAWWAFAGYKQLLQRVLGQSSMLSYLAAVVFAAQFGVEYAFNIGDASGAGTPFSSLVLQVSHAVLLLGLLLVPTKAVTAQQEGEEEKEKKSSGVGVEGKKLQ